MFVKFDLKWPFLPKNNFFNKTNPIDQIKCLEMMMLNQKLA